MHPDEYPDEYRTGYTHRTRSNRPRPRLVEVTSDNQALVRATPPPRLTDTEIGDIVDMILDRLRCKHPLAINATCQTCGDRLTSEDIA